MVAVGGTLYGTTCSCNEGGDGAVFAVTPAGVASVLHTFTGGADGSAPRAGLVDVGGILYGTTSAGGANDDGTVFSVTP